MTRRNPKEYPEFDWTKGQEGRARRDEGIERVLSTEEWWEANCKRLLRQQPPIGEYRGNDQFRSFKGEDFTAYAKPRIGEPHHSNSWGGMWNGAVCRGDVINLDRPSINASVNPKNNASKYALYRWPAKRGLQIKLKIPKDL